VGAICKVLGHLPRLTHLSNILETKSLPDTRSFNLELRHALERLAKAAPLLQCLDVGPAEDFQRRWLAIERKPDGQYEGYRWLQKREFRRMGVVVDEWGGFYFGTGKGSVYLQH
jgi:hypothetical protein